MVSINSVDPLTFGNRQVKTAVGLRGQVGDNVRALAGRDERPESAPAQTRRPAMEGKHVRGLLNSIQIVYLNSV